MPQVSVHEPIPNGGILWRTRQHFHRSWVGGRICEWVYRQSLPEAASGKNRVKANAPQPQKEGLCDFTWQQQRCCLMENLGIQVLLKGTEELIEYHSQTYLLGKT